MAKEAALTRGGMMVWMGEAVACPAEAAVVVGFAEGVVTSLVALAGASMAE